MVSPLRVYCFFLLSFFFFLFAIYSHHEISLVVLVSRLELRARLGRVLVYRAEGPTQLFFSGDINFSATIQQTFY